ncbi:MAG: patatin-like phospholipase family protein [Methylococcales bacterium]|nr:patatin-like phospholipase family protein [Methylococcales bacterium]
MSEQSLEKTGLALSGGGLRASFFHIGLLAQMAEQGLLRSVEVISTVSGGSIIGALYYLHLKKLLESKSDKDITDQDYIDFIKIIEVDFLKATEKNIRMSVLADIRKNFKMKNANYSRSDRIAELYNEYLYQSVLNNLGNPVEMCKLKIQPLGSPENFHPKKHNDNRQAKVPILVLNATTLNSGRNWQFSAQTMGEPPSRESTIRIDKKPIRLRRATGYQNMVEVQQDFPLGHAVAASACVPGLFTPLAVSDLYRDKDEAIVPQLVDGGVFDNQGIESLLKYECTRFIVSDASGQMGMENEVDTNPISVLLRVSSVLQDRVRTESLLHLIDSKGEENIVFINLRKGLGERGISWINKEGVPAHPDEVTPASSDKFGVDPEVQEKLSLMRTDLDAFTEVEAYSLMLDAYQMSKADLAQFGNAKSSSETSWQFSQIAELMEKPASNPKYLKQLAVSQHVFGKALKVFPWLWIPIVLVIGAILFYLWGSVIQPALHSSYTVIGMILAIALWLLTIFAPKVERIISFLTKFRPKALLLKRLAKAGLLILGTVFVIFYLKCINPMYLAQGRMTKLKK